MLIVAAIKRRFPKTSDHEINVRLGAVLATAGDREQGRKNCGKSNNSETVRDNINCDYLIDQPDS